MNKKILFLTILILTIGSNAQKKNSLIGNWKQIEEISSDGANKIRIPIKNGETLIFMNNNIVKDGLGNKGTYEFNGDKLHISLIKNERFYRFYRDNGGNSEKIYLSPVTSEYKIICDEGCAYIYEKIDNETEINNRKVYGVVKDSLGTLPGTNVIVEGTNKRVQTDFDGSYSINAKPNEFLVFTFIGMKMQRISADKNEINVQLKNDGMPDRIHLPEESNPPLQRKIKIYITELSSNNIKNANNPKYNFKKNTKKNVFVIFVSELKSYDFKKEDLEFQQKYNIKYSFIGNLKMEYLIKHNKLTFKHLKKKYKKTWQIEIRKDAVGIDKFLK